MAPIQKVSNQNKTSLFEALMKDHVPLNDRKPAMKTDVPSERAKEVKANAQARRDEWDNIESARKDVPKLRHNTPDEIDLTRSAHSIRSARCSPEGITNEGGSNRFVGSNNNSVWSAELLDIIANTKTSKENMLEEKESANRLRKMKQAEYRNAQLPRLGETEEAYMANRGNSVTPIHVQTGKYNPPVGKISIFDNEDFERIPEHKMEVRKAKKDDSWKQPQRNMSTKDIGNNLVDKLSSNAEENKYSSIHKDAVERIFEAIVNNINKNED